MFDFVFAVKEIPFRTFLLKYLIKAKIPDTQRMCISGQMTRIGGQNYVFLVTGGAPRGHHHFSEIFKASKNLLAGLKLIDVNRAAKVAFLDSRRKI